MDLGSTVLVFPDNTFVTFCLNGHTLNKCQSGFTFESDVKLRNAVDISEDGIVNITDLGCIKANYGKTYDNVSVDTENN